MPVWRMEAEPHSVMRAHSEFVHHVDAQGQEQRRPMFHGLAEGQPQHDGSFVFHCSHNFAERLRGAGFNPEFVSEHVLQYHSLHDELGRRVGIWSVWTALGGRAHRPELEPQAEVHALYAQHTAGELDDLALLAALRRLHAQ